MKIAQLQIPRNDSVFPEISTIKPTPTPTPEYNPILVGSISIISVIIALTITIAIILGIHKLTTLRKN